MRVITGIARGKRLITPENYDIRPVSESVKESIFSSIQFEIEGAVVLDLFAGTGQMGIEALSRGASKAVFVDSDAAAISIVRRNIKSVGSEANSEVYHTPFYSYLKSCREVFDIAIIDPPYERKMIAKLLPSLVECMSDKGKIICKHEKEAVLPESVGEFTVKKVYSYGKTKVTVYHRLAVGEE